MYNICMSNLSKAKNGNVLSNFVFCHNFQINYNSRYVYCYFLNRNKKYK